MLYPIGVYGLGSSAESVHYDWNESNASVSHLYRMRMSTKMYDQLKYCAYFIQCCLSNDLRLTFNSIVIVERCKASFCFIVYTITKSQMFICKNKAHFGCLLLPKAITLQQFVAFSPIANIVTQNANNIYSTSYMYTTMSLMYRCMKTPLFPHPLSSAPFLLHALALFQSFSSHLNKLYNVKC